MAFIKTLLRILNTSCYRTTHSEKFQDKTNHSSRADKEVHESVESFIRALQCDAQFVGATYSLVEQSSLKVKGPDL